MPKKIQRKALSSSLLLLRDEGTKKTVEWKKDKDTNTFAMHADPLIRPMRLEDIRMTELDGKVMQQIRSF